MIAPPLFKVYTIKEKASTMKMVCGSFIILSLWSQLMFKKFKLRLLYILLAGQLGIKEAGSVRLTNLRISDYTRHVMEENQLLTVQDGVLAYCLHQETPGIGKGSWDDFLRAIS